MVTIYRIAIGLSKSFLLNIKIIYNILISLHNQCTISMLYNRTVMELMLSYLEGIAQSVMDIANVTTRYVWKIMVCYIIPVIPTRHKNNECNEECCLRTHHKIFCNFINDLHISNCLCSLNFVEFLKTLSYK